MSKIQFTKHKIYSNEDGFYKSIYDILIKKIEENDYNKEISFTYREKKFIFTIKCDLNRKIILFDIKYGLLNPNNVWDESEKKYRNDILTIDKVHITEQFFLFITNNNNDCYISSIDYKSIFLHFLKEKYKINISIEDIRKNFEELKKEFESELKTISNIRIKCCNDLFYKEIFNNNNILGSCFDCADVIELNFKFNSKIAKTKSKEMINHITGNYHIEDYDFQGDIDDSHILKFNKKNLIKSLIINDIEKDNDGYYELSEVFEKFMELLNERN